MQVSQGSLKCASNGASATPKLPHGQQVSPLFMPSHCPRPFILVHARPHSLCSSFGAWWRSALLQLSPVFGACWPFARASGKSVATSIGMSVRKWSKLGTVLTWPCTSWACPWGARQHVSHRLPAKHHAGCPNSQPPVDAGRCPSEKCSALFCFSFLLEAAQCFVRDSRLQITATAVEIAPTCRRGVHAPKPKLQAAATRLHPRNRRLRPCSHRRLHSHRRLPSHRRLQPLSSCPPRAAPATAAT